MFKLFYNTNQVQIYTVYVYIYLPTYLPIYLSIHPSIHLIICVYMCLYVFICVYMCLYVFICVYMCLYMFIYVDMCLYVCLFAYICVYNIYQKPCSKVLSSQHHSAIPRGSRPRDALHSLGMHHRMPEKGEAKPLSSARSPSMHSSDNPSIGKQT